MSETSGFFDAQLIDGEYDRVYYAEQFANYFKRLVGNGVFASPVNQLKVSVGNGMNVLVGSGNAFINGYWYNNSESKALTINPNTGNRDRIDSIKLRYSNALRSISVNVYEGTTDVIQTEGRYELKLAEITVKPLTAEITANDIKDTRMDESVCGFVKGLIELVDTEDLFSQYNAIFNTWFESVQDIIASTRYQQLLEDVDNIKDGTFSVPNAIHATNADGATEAAHSVSSDNATHALNADSAIDSNNATHANAASSADNDIILLNQGALTFIDRVCTLNDARITVDSLADVYFTGDTEIIAQKAKISVDTYNGNVKLTTDREPDGVIKASIRIRVV